MKVIHTIKYFIEEQFELNICQLDKLYGYDNFNYLVKTAESKFIFKTYLKEQNLELLIEAENDLLFYLNKQNPLNFAKPITNKFGHSVIQYNTSEENYICRLLSYMEGELMGDFNYNEIHIQSLGSFLALMDLQLLNYNNEIIKNRKWNWSIKYYDLNIPLINDIENANDRKIVKKIFNQYEKIVVPKLFKLRYSIIHNDANLLNILTINNEVTSIIDFGDVAYLPLINELAVAIAYTCFDQEDPLKIASILVKSYHDILRIEEKEIEVLYYLIALRLCISICNAAHAKIYDPENEYAFSSLRRALELLHKWEMLSPEFVENRFRTIIGLDVINSNENRH